MVVPFYIEIYNIIFAYSFFSTLRKVAYALWMMYDLFVCNFVIFCGSFFQEKQDSEELWSWFYRGEYKSFIHPCNSISLYNLQAYICWHIILIECRQSKLMSNSSKILIDNINVTVYWFLWRQFKVLDLGHYFYVETRKRVQLGT